MGRSFWLLYSGETASAVGTAASVVGLPVVCLHLTGDVRQAGLTGTALSLGILAARLPAGAAADRYDRRTIMIVGDLLGAFVLGSLAVMLACSWAPAPVLMVAAALLGATGSTLAPAENAAVRSWVPEESLPQALSLLQARAAVALIIGPLAGGALLMLDAPWIFAADASTYLVAAVCLAAMGRGPRVEASAERGLRGAMAGLRFIARSPFLRYAAINATVVNLVFNGLLIVIVASVADGGGGEAGVGLQTAALGAGGLVGSLIAVPAAKRAAPAWGIATATALIAGSLFLFALLHSGWAAGVCLIAASATAPVITVLISVVQMRITPPELQGRVHSGVGFLAQTASPLGPVLAGASTHALGITHTVVIAACAVLSVAAAGLAAGVKAPLGLPAPHGPATPLESRCD
ncbi:MFS transporter [Streptomyces mobaraensis]|uniref:MFS transporter n=1 Tax=Streptomyces mobaraensis TaxID=35621 RepID=UPI00331F93E4